MQTLIGGAVRLLSLALLTGAITACSLQPIARTDLADGRVGEVRAALAAFEADGRLAAFFEEAAVVAVFPSNTRAASGFGGAYGRGLVFDQAGSVIAHSRMWQLSVGAQLGGQVYRQILFFKSAEVYERFLGSTAEFAGQANATLVTLGVAATPSFHSDIALFTQLRGGLLIEASVGAHGYHFAPIVATRKSVGSARDALKVDGKPDL